LGQNSLAKHLYIFELFAMLKHEWKGTRATVGYTRLFGTGNALNYGGGINLYIKDGTRALRFEVRDYLRFADFNEHSAAFRIGYLFGAHGQ
jgi:hypothetical protein